MNAALRNLRDSLTAAVDSLPLPSHRLAAGVVKWQMLLLLNDFDQRLKALEVKKGSEKNG